MTFFSVFSFFPSFLDLRTSLNRIFRGDEQPVNGNSSFIDFRHFKSENRKVRKLRTSQFANFSMFALEMTKIDETRPLDDVLFIARKNPIQRSTQIQTRRKKYKKKKIHSKRTMNNVNVVQKKKNYSINISLQRGYCQGAPVFSIA